MICNECETVAHCLKNGCVPKTTKKDEALKLALEALESKYIVNCGAWRVQQDQAITVIREALASEAIEQPAQQEPVAHLWKHSQTGRTRVVMPGGIITADASWFVVGPLVLGNTTPPAAQRQWVGLTDDEALTEAARHLGEMHVENCGLSDIKDFACAIEAKLKAKNSP